MERPEAFSSHGEELHFPYKHALVAFISLTLLIITLYGIWVLKTTGDYILSPIKTTHHFTYQKPVQSGLQTVPFLVNLSRPALPVDEDNVSQDDPPSSISTTEAPTEIIQEYPWEHDKSLEWLRPERKRTILRVPDQYPTIQQAIEAAVPGNQIIIAPGTYEESFVIDKTIEIGATEPGTVTLRTDADSPVIQVRNGAVPRISFLTFEHLPDYKSDEPAALLFIADASPTIERCIFQFSQGSGIEITGDTTTRIIQSHIQRNRGFGVHVVGKKAQVVLIENQIQSNELTGVVIAEGARAAIRKNIIIANGWDGVGVFDPETNPLIYSNTISDNGRRGLAFSRGAKGLAQSNTIESNAWDGIVVLDPDTAPILNYNIIRRNNARGIHFMDGAKGVANANLVENNFETGIMISGADTQPELNFNRSNKNGLWGYDYDQGAQIVRGRGNSAHGNSAGPIRNPPHHGF
ncbi:MAG: right-handed parallel beta-helix repeat-containing protein [Methylacidiphilales bacterium]|nr:right-handed parallel beta-helix repeat-containing protein [Candidatus Methylacidiphilales bacterium]MDW8349712.1 right-handed parallel beta-helix repeat-containing protein [Verrucomicrobiae bacterium]